MVLIHTKRIIGGPNTINSFSGEVNKKPVRVSLGEMENGDSAVMISGGHQRVGGTVSFDTLEEVKQVIADLMELANLWQDEPYK